MVLSVPLAKTLQKTLLHGSTTMFSSLENKKNKQSILGYRINK